MATDDETAIHETAFAASRVDRDRTLRAIHRFETALAMAAEGETWLTEVTTDLQALETAMIEEQRELNRPDALLAMIAAEHPRRFSSRIRNLREQYDDIIRLVASLRDQVAPGEDTHPDAGDLRERASWIIRSLHHCRARQTDLVYEAIAMDLGER
jgi:hypothetical protein